MWYSEDVGGKKMKKVMWLVLAVLAVWTIPTEFPQTGGNLKPVAVLAPINEQKGEQK